MVQHVLLQHTSIREGFPALRAHVRPLTCMHTHVNCYLVCHCETFATHCALEWPFPCVGEPVGAHCPHLGESLATIRANVRLLAGVNPGVTPQSSCCGETL